MKWAYRIKRKITAAILLTSVFVAMIAKNMVDNNYVSQLGTSFSSVYEDRLIVESYIYQISDHLFRKKIMVDTFNSQEFATFTTFIDSHNAAINRILLDYEKTNLTEAESHYFKAFKENNREIMKLESQYIHQMDNPGTSSSVKTFINREFNLASNNLHQLSGIQVSEGKALNDHSKKIIAGSSLLTQFEIGILIAIGLIIMVLIFESKSVLPMPLEKSGLN